MSNIENLPELPDGWRWSSNPKTGNWMATLGSIVDVSIEVEVSASGVEIGHDQDYSPAPVPLEVIAAALKANGVEL